MSFSLKSVDGLSLVVLAAGVGSRYGGLKQVAPVGPNGELIIDYSIYDAIQAGFEKVVFVINRNIDWIFRDVIGKRIEKQCDTTYVYQELDKMPEGLTVPSGRKKPWGTAHATLMAKDVINAPFAVINADDFYGQASYRLIAQYLAQFEQEKRLDDYCMVGFRLDNTVSEHGYVSRGVCESDLEGYLVDINERTRIEKFNDLIRFSEDGGESWTELAGDSIVSMNLWGFTPGICDVLETRFQTFLEMHKEDITTVEYFLPGVVKELVVEKKARVKVLTTDEQWFGATYQQDLPKVEEAIAKLIQKGVYPESLWS